MPFNDPGDENDYTGPSVQELRDAALARLESTNHPPFVSNDPTFPVASVEPVEPHISSRSYKATYRAGSVFRTVTMMGYDSFAATAALAAGEAMADWKLVGLTELT